MLLKQQKASAEDGFELSSLSLEDPPPVEEAVTNVTSAKVSLNIYSLYAFVVCALSVSDKIKFPPCP